MKQIIRQLDIMMNLFPVFSKMLPLAMLMAITSCNDIEGDNSDYNFDHETTAIDCSRLPDSYRLATYNTHRCASPNNTCSYDKTASVISLIDADVIALQELDCRTNRHAEDQLQELATRTGMHPTFLACVKYESGGSYGIGMLSRQKPLSVYTRDLPGSEKRGLILAEFEDFIFICTHLCVSSANNRSWSYDIINQYIADNLSNYRKPIYLAGDLNATSLPESATSHWQTISTSSVTFFSSSRRIDYVLQYKDNNASYKVLRTMVPTFDQVRLTEISDHLPVIVDLAKN